jgi:hypothetical protein
MSERFASIKRVFDPLIARCATAKRSTLAWIGLALAAVVLLSVNLTSSIGLKTWSADLTQDRLFTISEGTREVLKSIDEPISARLYFSRNLAAASPDVARYFDRIRTLFEQYRDISGGKLQLSILDPEPFSEAEDKAVASGLKGLRLNAEGEVAYFGLVASNATDNQQTIPFFSPDRESFLEYDVTKLIYALANPKKRTIGLMTSLPLDGGKSPMRDQATQRWLIMSQIREWLRSRSPASPPTPSIATPDRRTHKLRQMPAGKKLKYVNSVDEIIGSASYVDFKSVRKAGKSDALPRAGKVNLVTDKGLKVELDLRSDGKQAWVRISASGDGDGKKDADAMSALVNGWEFEIPVAKISSLMKKQADLLEDAPS